MKDTPIDNFDLLIEAIPIEEILDAQHFLSIDELKLFSAYLITEKFSGERYKFPTKIHKARIAKFLITLGKSDKDITYALDLTPITVRNIRADIERTDT